MQILVIGSGGREHAIVHAISKSKIIADDTDGVSAPRKHLHSAPGNSGIAQSAQCHQANINAPDEVLALCKKYEIDLAIVGPEEPLIAGVSDILRNNGIKVFGPVAKGAKLEGSKSFSKQFMVKNGIPTAGFDVCTTMDQCREALEKRRGSRTFVIKADGLAAGKGVFLPETFDEAYAVCGNLLERHFLGSAGSTLVIEDCVEGRELSVIAMTDGADAILLEPSQDHKRVFEGNKGPNTGGMGVYAPVPWVDEALIERIKDQVLTPTLDGLKKEGIIYCGVIYMGLMIKSDGELCLLEYNSRFGDPETQAILPIFNGDFGEAVLACCSGTLGEYAKGYSLGSLSGKADGGKSSICVVLTSGGYPGFFEPGKIVNGIANAEKLPGIEIYHAGTKADGEGNIRTTSGRVLGVTAVSDNAEHARAAVYEAIKKIKFDKMHYRTDIGPGA